MLRFKLFLGQGISMGKRLGGNAFRKLYSLPKKYFKTMFTAAGNRFAVFEIFVNMFSCLEPWSKGFYYCCERRRENGLAWQQLELGIPAAATTFLIDEIQISCDNLDSLLFSVHLDDTTWANNAIMLKFECITLIIHRCVETN